MPLSFPLSACRPLGYLGETDVNANRCVDGKISQRGEEVAAETFDFASNNQACGDKDAFCVACSSGRLNTPQSIPCLCFAI